MVSRPACISYDEHDDKRMANLSSRLGLPLLRPGHGDPAWAEAVTHWLFYRDGRLCLQANQPRPPSPTCVDFRDPALSHRLATSGKSQGVGKAVGIRKLDCPSVLDATAGLGRDAFILAALGCRVILLERSPLIHVLLEDGMRRGREEEEEKGEGGKDVRAILDRMSLYHADARQWLADIRADGRERPDVVYLDPMFSPSGSSAKVKKDISLLQQLLEPDEEFDELLTLALYSVRHRVVVKRPGPRTRAGVRPPAFQVPGKAAHFDVYLPASATAKP